MMTTLSFGSESCQKHLQLKMGSRHVMECKVLSSMEVKVVIAWSRNILNSMEFHYITRLTFTKCTPVDIMESSMLLQG